VLLRRLAATALAGLIYLPALAPAQPAPAPVPGLSDAQREEMVGAHNQWRIRVGVAPLRWSAELARQSQTWATFLATENRCKMKHSNDDEGENVFWGGALLWSDGRVEINPITGADVANSWGEESRFYSAADGDCLPGKVCGHYTQVVWSETQELGCGRQICADKSQIWVCQYRPAGNIIGQRPY
jgi:pathogenesis-related protein 1